MRNMETKAEQVNIHASAPPAEYVHELETGTLTVTFTKEKDIEITDANDNVIARAASSAFIVSLMFDSESGVTFGVTYESATLGGFNPLLTLEDEARVVFSTKPSWTGMAKDRFDVNFIVRSSTKEYPFTLSLSPRKSTPVLSDIPKLQAENRALRRQLRDLTEEVEKNKERTDSAIDAIKNLLFDRWSSEPGHFTELAKLTGWGTPFIPDAYNALVNRSNVMWDCLLEYGYADYMMRGPVHILLGVIGDDSMPRVIPVAIPRLIRLVNCMSPSGLGELRFFGSNKTILQILDEHLADEKLSVDIRAQWKTLRDAVVTKLAQPQARA